MIDSGRREGLRELQRPRRGERETIVRLTDDVDVGAEREDAGHAHRAVDRALPADLEITEPVDRHRIRLVSDDDALVERAATGAGDDLPAMAVGSVDHRLPAEADSPGAEDGGAREQGLARQLEARGGREPWLELARLGRRRAREADQ